MEVKLSKVNLENEDYFTITNVDEMRPFFMSIVSNSDHWMFISSNTGLSAGRKNAQFPLFPYYTDDKITESAEITGCKSIFIIDPEGSAQVWEPFSCRNEGRYDVTRNLYKSVYGNKIIFEEVNKDLSLTYRFQWASSDKFGFIKTAKLLNQGALDRQVNILDGLQNIVPAGVPSDLQNSSSNLVDAYKRSEINMSTGLGIYALSAIIVDRAEPSEALKANVVWSLGFDNPKILLSSQQLARFRKGKGVNSETDVKAEKGAYFLNQQIHLHAHHDKEWMIVANVNQTHNDIAFINHLLSDKDSLKQQLRDDIAEGTSQLIQLNSGADSLQLTADSLRDARHFSNALFNIMRGGIFDNNYQIEKWDFEKYLYAANHASYELNQSVLSELSEVFNISDLRQVASEVEDLAFQRLCFEYLPLKFSRRHGDPSRPWNVFSINTRDESTGSKILDYEGNWRDIFQNWEALAYSYPAFIESMIHKFLNASTFDGYNPYRVTKGGFDWEAIEEDDPWSYIGYWGDHQIIYLLKFLEFIENVSPGRLNNLFNKDVFVYANVPYKIKKYEDIVKNPKDTIVFDAKKDHTIRERRNTLGADGALLTNPSGEIYTVNFIEKILATVLSKISNFIPEGGIWMNTQRPEWNDANNALVGDGISMVTLCYLHRFLKFFKQIFQSNNTSEFLLSVELLDFFLDINRTLQDNVSLLSNPISDTHRKNIVDQLGKAGSEYRSQIYQDGFSNQKSSLPINSLISFIDTALSFFEHTINANRRDDELYHAYNLLTIGDSGMSISHLYEMLEGQVAVLSSGHLSTAGALRVLNALKISKLFRKDQYSYLLYPNKELPLFRNKNTIDNRVLENSELLRKLIEAKDNSVVTQDISGGLHFNGNFKNADDLRSALDQLDEKQYGTLITSDREIVLDIFEAIFDHKSFTGRSGTFFGYEGLGSIYWHMVSKLQLAVLECCHKAISDNEDEVTIGKLLEHYYEINAGIGVHKSPKLYGAFPTDPYSHTPANKGAQQPGMTGQVKEDIISRFGELGVSIEQGGLGFFPNMLRKEEFIKSEDQFNYFDVNQEKKSILLPPNSLCFSFCQVPIVYHISNIECIEIKKRDHDIIRQNGGQLDLETSKEIFSRSGVVQHLIVHINGSTLK